MRMFNMNLATYVANKYDTRLSGLFMFTFFVCKVFMFCLRSDRNDFLSIKVCGVMYMSALLLKDTPIKEGVFSSSVTGSDSAVDHTPLRTFSRNALNNMSIE